MPMGMASPQVRVHVSEALTFVRALDFARMEASVNCVIKLNVESKRTDERVRGMAFLPHGRGKTTRVAVFARGALADEATDAGADLVGAEELVEQVRHRRRRRHRHRHCPSHLTLSSLLTSAPFISTTRPIRRRCWRAS